MRFKSNHKTSLFAFLTVCVIIVTYLVSTLCVFADDTIDLVSYYNISGTVGSSENVAFADSSDDCIDLYNQLFSGGLLTCPASYSSLLSECPNYVVMAGVGSDTRIDIFPLPEHSFIISDKSKTNKFTIFYTNEEQESGQATSFWYYDYPLPIGFKGMTDFSLTYDSYQEVDGRYYSVMPSNNINYQCILESNVPIYYTSDSYSDIDTVDGLNDYNSSNPSENDSNNLFMSDTDFLWTTYGYFEEGALVGSQYILQNVNPAKGSVAFMGNPNDYQNQHASNFTLYIDYSIIYSVPSYFSGTLNDSTYKNFMGHYLYSIPFTQFISNGCVVNNSFSTIFYESDFTNFLNTNDIMYHPVAKSGTFTLTAKAYIKSSNFNDDISGDYSETYNFITNKITTDSISLNNNNNPYMDDNGISNSTTNNNTTNNTSNNNSITINNNNEETVNAITNNLVQESENKNNLANKLAENGDYNGFLSLFASMFSFIPASVWEMLEKFLFVTLGILVAFVGIKCLCDLL